MFGLFVNNKLIINEHEKTPINHAVVFFDGSQSSI